MIVNQTAGTGQSETRAEKLSSCFTKALAALSQVAVESVSNHAAARACAAEFISQSQAPALVVAGGGGGTLRAVIEGVCDSAGLPGPHRVRIAALRMGSGNLLAKQFGVPADPVVALAGLLLNLTAGITAPCCVMRCQTWTSSGESEVHHAVSLGGLGQFGRIPSDLARWHADVPVVRKAAARLFGLEKINDVEYALAVLLRSLSSVVFPNGAAKVAIQFQNQTEHLRLLSGVVMNFPIAALPFTPDVAVEDEALMVYLISHTHKWSPLLQVVAPERLIPHTRAIRIEKDQQLEVRFVQQGPVEFFLDEDPVTTHGQLGIGVAGSIAFVPGPDYRLTANRGVFK